MPVLDQNQNQNQNQSIGSAVERRFRTRYNTDIFARLVDTTPPFTKLVPPTVPPVGGVYPPCRWWRCYCCYCLYCCC